KPLLKAAGKPLIEYHLEKLAAAGVREVVINHGRMGRRIEEALGAKFRGMEISYSAEGDEPLDTGGGIFHALPLLGRAPFILVNADVWSDLNYALLPRTVDAHAHLVLVPNPVHHPDGDFALKDGCLSLDGVPRHTYGGMGVFRASMFEECSPGRRPWVADGRAVSGSLDGHWHAGALAGVGGNALQIKHFQINWLITDPALN